MTSTSTPLPIMPTAAELFDRPSAPTPWPSSREVLDLGIEMLLTIATDSRTAVAHAGR